MVGGGGEELENAVVMAEEMAVDKADVRAVDKDVVGEDVEEGGTEEH